LARGGFAVRSEKVGEEKKSKTGGDPAERGR